MRQLAAAIAAALAVAAAGCGEDGDSGRPSSDRVVVPNVVGEKANHAAARVEGAGLSVTYDPEPSEDAELCTVDTQHPTGKADEGSEVTLFLDCQVEVPDVTGKPANRAQA